VKIAVEYSSPEASTRCPFDIGKILNMDMNIMELIAFSSF
jgi:hypothetical protein